MQIFPKYLGCFNLMIKHILRKRVKQKSCIHPLFKVVGTFNQRPKLIFVIIATAGGSVKILQLVSTILSKIFKPHSNYTIPNTPFKIPLVTKHLKGCSWVYGWATKKEYIYLSMLSMKSKCFFEYEQCP